ncbi:MAG TPA: FGGY family carbohydrate kinase [Bryobacteraceae bacterium]|nr:FGGY family carbohydrate kinase [Bryobacteraceae bacterium]
MKQGRGAVLAIDLGTGSCKGALYSLDGEQVAISARAYDVRYPQPGFAEQSPGDYLKAPQLVSDELCATARVAGLAIIAVSFSTQTPTLVFCDEHLNPVRPAIIWQDSRAVQQAELLKQLASEVERREWFGMDLPLSAASTPAKLMWMARQEPEAWDRTRWVLQPKDYAAAALTGEEPATDGWCAKGLAHVETRTVAPEFLATLGKSESPCPRVLLPSDQVGVVTHEASKHWGIPAGVPVMVGWSDATAGMLSTGACEVAGRGFIITGTSEIIGTSRRSPASHPGVFRVPAHLLPDRNLELHFGPTQAGGSAVDWLARISGRTTAELLDLVPSDPQPTPILFRPHLAGERAPYWDHSLTASFDGLRIEHGLSDLAVAVLQGIALQERLVLQCAELDWPAAEVVVAGGAARHQAWNQVRANILQRPLLAMRDLEASLRGAAMIGWAGMGAIDLKRLPACWFATDPLDPAPEWASFARDLMERFAQPSAGSWRVAR